MSDDDMEEYVLFGELDDYVASDISFERDKMCILLEDDELMGEVVNDLDDSEIYTLEGEMHTNDLELLYDTSGWIICEIGRGEMSAYGIFERSKDVFSELCKRNDRIEETLKKIYNKRS